jgi:HEPN domain-containing protein
MVARAHDWFRQAERDLALAGRLLNGGDFEWACFASQQAAVKAVKAVHQRLNAEVRGHAVSLLLQALSALLPPDRAAGITPAMIDAARQLDRLYIGTRYPNAHPQGAPFEFYTRADAEQAIQNGRLVLCLCAGLLNDGRLEAAGHA